MLIGNSDPDESPGFSQTPDLDYLAGVWEDAARRLPRVEEASMKTLNAGLYEVSPDHNAILGPVPEFAAIRAGERVLRARDAALPGGGQGDFRGDRGRGVEDAGYQRVFGRAVCGRDRGSGGQRDLREGLFGGRRRAGTPTVRMVRRQGTADLRSASRGSAKRAPMAQRHTNVRAAPPFNPGGSDRSLLPLSRALVMPGGVYGPTSSRGFLRDGAPRPASLRDRAAMPHDVVRPNGSAGRRSSWCEDALGTGSTGKPPGFSQTPDLGYGAGVWGGRRATASPSSSSDRHLATTAISANNSRTCPVETRILRPGTALLSPVLRM